MEYLFYTIIILFILFLIFQWRTTLNQKKRLENQLEQKVKELKDINDEKIKFETLVNESKDKSKLIDNERNKVIENFKEYFNSSLINQFSDATEKSNKVILETAKNTFAGTRFSFCVCIFGGLLGLSEGAKRSSNNAVPSSLFPLHVSTSAVYSIYRKKLLKKKRK